MRLVLGLSVCVATACSFDKEVRTGNDSAVDGRVARVVFAVADENRLRAWTQTESGAWEPEGRLPQLPGEPRYVLSLGLGSSEFVLSWIEGGAGVQLVMQSDVGDGWQTDWTEAAALPPNGARPFDMVAGSDGAP